VNALHHFPSPVSFIAECRRVLRSGGQLLTIGLDPHQGNDQWWIYDYFPAALVLDCARYPSTATIRTWATDAGFRDVSTSIAQHIPGAVPFEQAVAEGLVDRTSTSQLMVISDADFDAGRARLTLERPVLRADLRLYASIARL
jgi:SAM-dependent methyltransferase